MNAFSNNSPTRVCGFYGYAINDTLRGTNQTILQQMYTNSEEILSFDCVSTEAAFIYEH